MGGALSALFLLSPLCGWARMRFRWGRVPLFAPAGRGRYHSTTVNTGGKSFRVRGTLATTGPRDFSTCRRRRGCFSPLLFFLSPFVRSLATATPVVVVVVASPSSPGACLPVGFSGFVWSPSSFFLPLPSPPVQRGLRNGCVLSLRDCR